MTTDKAFKRVVRARMAKTGERYAAARRTLIEGASDGPHAEPTADAATPSGYRMRGGLHPETATLANVLANQGVVSGLTGEPLTEAAILGIGGGLGAGYILWEFQSTAGRSSPSASGTSGSTRDPRLDRQDARSARHRARPARDRRREGAREALDARLDAGVPVIASVDLQSIGTWGQPDALSGYFGLVVVVFGRDADGWYLVDDRGREPIPRVTGRDGRRTRTDRLVQAPDRRAANDARTDPGRTASGGDARWPRGPGGPPALPIRLVLAPGLAQVGRLMTDQRNAKAWPRVFADGHGLFGALSAILESVDGQVGPWGGHLRELYAASLDEAAVASTTPRSATRRGHGGASPTDGRSLPTRGAARSRRCGPRRSRRSRHFTRR